MYVPWLTKLATFHSVMAASLFSLSLPAEYRDWVQIIPGKLPRNLQPKIEEPEMGQKKWALGKRHLWGKS